MKTEFEVQKFIAHCYDSESKIHIKEKYSKGESVIILIGPEGDFSLDEVEIAKESGYTEISISDSRLRTETAGIAACQIIEFINF